MKRFLVGSSMLGGLLLTGLATPAFALPCQTDTFAAYEALGSCTVGDKVFSGFLYTPVTANAPAATDVTVVPLQPGVAPLGPNEEGLKFALAATVAGPGSLLDTSWLFKVGTVSGNATITDAGLSIVGQLSDANGFGGVAETVAFPGGGTGTLSTSLPGKLSDLITFGPFSTISPEKDLTVGVGPLGTGSSFASISVVNQVFSQTVPEPASLAILGAGLIGLGMARRRRKSA